jgi:hypothetical protein
MKIVDNLILEILNYHIDDLPDATLLLIKDEIIQALVDLPVDTLIDDLYDI